LDVEAVKVDETHFFSCGRAARFSVAGSEPSKFTWLAMITIREAQQADFDSIWQIFHEVVSLGSTYAFSPETTREEAHAVWMSPQTKTYVAFLDDEMVGTYILRANHPGLGAHVANAAYMVRAVARGKGVGAAMCQHSLEQARNMKFLAMQFNLVVSTNANAIRLWQQMGFQVVGTLPQAFRHTDLGLVDAYVMHRFL
jgi:L-amino acid N-acyltransferase YncA